MTIRNFLCSAIFFSIAVLLNFQPVRAQQESLTSVPVSYQARPNENRTNSATAPTAFEATAKPAAAPGENDFGSVIGRVLYDNDPTAETQTVKPEGIAGVKVLARRVNAGFANFYFESVSGDDGTFEFKYLRPGEYTIEIDRGTLPATVPAPNRQVATLRVEVARRTRFDLRVVPQRLISGTVFIDNDGDGRYSPGKDETVSGAYVMANGNFAVSDENGAYVLCNLPAGRLGLLLISPKKDENTHLVLDIGTGPMTKRIVNIPVTR